MVVAPLRHDAFKAKIPSELRNDGPAAPDTLVIIVGRDSSLTLNNEPSLGTANDPQPLIARLKNVFEQRATNGAVMREQAFDVDRPFDDHVERTVFIEAPKYLDYGSVARVVDAAKLAGAYPNGLQIDYLE
jgi:biopolymer transport protein ExbD